MGRPKQFRTAAKVAVGLAAGLVVGTGPAGAQERARSGVRHLQVAGDIDTGAMVERIEAAVDDMESRRAALILLELSGNSARVDLVRSLGASLSERETPIAAWLVDREDGRVGVGQLLLGAQLEHCFLDPGTRVVTGDDLSGLSPEGTDFERVHRELAAPVWLRLHAARAWAAPCARALVYEEPLRMRRGEDASVMSGDPYDWVDEGPERGPDRGPDHGPDEGDADWVVLVDDAGRVDLGADVLAEIGLVMALAERDFEIVRELDAGRAVGRTVRVASELRAAHAEAQEKITALGALLDETEESLEVDDDGRSRRSAVAMALRRATPLIRVAAGGMTEMERMISEFPEIMALPLGASGGAEPSKIPSMEHREAWMEEFGAFRERLEAIRERYERLSGGRSGG